MRDFAEIAKPLLALSSLEKPLRAYKMITYGVESGSLRVRTDILRRPVDDSRIEAVMGWTKAAGMMATASYMIGIPGETRADLEMTARLIERLDCCDFNCSVFYPFPGTAL